MKKILVLIDVQRDFIDGKLPAKNATKALENIHYLIENESFDKIIATVDNHMNAFAYNMSYEGLKIPFHCNTDEGIMMDEECIKHSDVVFSKNNFISRDLLNYLSSIANETDWQRDDVEITFVGFCTDICVLVNAINARGNIDTMYATIKIKADCCAGTNVEAHNAALKIAERCLIEVE